MSIDDDMDKKIVYVEDIENITIDELSKIWKIDLIHGYCVVKEKHEKNKKISSAKNDGS